MRSFCSTVTFFALLLGSGGQTADLPDAMTGVALVFRGVAVEQGYEKAEFALTNGTAHSIWFEGYDLEHPVYQVETVRSNRWVIAFAGQCALGSKRLELPAQKSHMFRA